MVTHNSQPQYISLQDNGFIFVLLIVINGTWCSLSFWRPMFIHKLVCKITILSIYIQKTEILKQSYAKNGEVILQEMTITCIL